MTMMVSQRHNRRRGPCDWCGRNKKLTYTVYVMGGSYHAACICPKCLEEYEANLSRKIHRECKEVTGDE